MSVITVEYDTRPDPQGIAGIPTQTSYTLRYSLARKESTLVMFPGLIARYGRIAIFDDLQDSLGERSLWVLVG